jgi:predicted amidophosphoribosyltransferase
MVTHRTERVATEGGRPADLHVLSASLFEGTTRDAVIGLKYRNERRNARALAELLVPLLGEDVDLLTWVPTAEVRRRERGIDHAELIARHLGALSGMPVARLLRRLGTSQQTGAARPVRLEGPRFVAHRRCAGLGIVIVDDVVTTGSTLGSAARALLHGGARDVSAVTVAAVR